MSMNRRSLLTALAGGCVAAGALAALGASPAAAVPRATPPKPASGETAGAAPEAEGEGEARLHNAQFIVIRRRPRRRWVFRRRRRVYFY